MPASGPPRYVMNITVRGQETLEEAKQRAMAAIQADAQRQGWSRWTTDAPVVAPGGKSFRIAVYSDDDD